MGASSDATAVSSTGAHWWHQSGSHAAGGTESDKLADWHRPLIKTTTLLLLQV